MVRIHSLGLGLLFCCLCWSCNTDGEAGTDEPPAKPLNIILIVTDDQGYGDLGAHGNPWLKTPHLDRLHDESVRFSNFHVATTCAPTRAGILSGVNCNRAGAWHTVMGRSFLGRQFRTLPEELGEEGYRSGIFGKWHLGDNYPFRPQDRGFDETLVHGGGGVGQTPDVWNNDYFDDIYRHNGEEKQYAGYCTDIWFAEAMKWMAREMENDQPFFTYIATNAPHSPFHVADKYTDPYRNNSEIVSPEFYGMIANVDENVGRLREWLTATGLADNTLLIFTTDNGTSAGVNLDEGKHAKRGFNAGMRGKKVDEYEGGHRVPLFFHFPDERKVAPREVTTLTTYTDLLPTLVDLAGGSLELDYALDGQSLTSLFAAEPSAELRERVVVVDTQREDLPVKGKRSCVMQANWRLINGDELYHLERDPGQRENLAAGNPKKVAELRQGYEDWWQRLLPDIALTNRIIVGNPAESPSLLTAHDWHAQGEPPWHQRHVRAAHRSNGYWALSVAEAGSYRMRAYRYPPATKIPLAATAPALPPVPGGDGLAAAVEIQPIELVIEVSDQEKRQQITAGAIYGESVLELAEGPVDLTATFKLADGGTTGVYYLEVEKLSR